METQFAHCWTLQLTQTVPLLVGFPDWQVVQTFVVWQRVHPLILQRMHPPEKAVYGEAQRLQLLGPLQLRQFARLHVSQLPPKVETEKLVAHCEQKLGEEH